MIALPIEKRVPTNDRREDSDGEKAQAGTAVCKTKTGNKQINAVAPNQPYRFA